jgi:hypothetical protein
MRIGAAANCPLADHDLTAPGGLSRALTGYIATR